MIIDIDVVLTSLYFSKTGVLELASEQGLQ